MVFVDPYYKGAVGNAQFAGWYFRSVKSQLLLAYNPLPTHPHTQQVQNAPLELIFTLLLWTDTRTHIEPWMDKSSDRIKSP